MPRVPRVRGAAALGLLALAGLLAGCTSAPTPTPTTTPTPTVRPAGDGTLTIGTLLPTTGAAPTSLRPWRPP
ncbi:hypothetical protein [Pseudolysinimonas kribbensis]|uniref:hypothetical protein n=1 Tax=Pseudolysinimonas kribbensis TaxID=433641 RepID=UPI0024E13000|nr:hypothetical protein [Pseudolysinimonas kribbensis]